MEQNTVVGDVRDERRRELRVEPTRPRSILVEIEVGQERPKIESAARR
jgi:hypothetical protein